MPEESSHRFDVGARAEERRREEVAELVEVPELDFPKLPLKTLPGGVERTFARRCATTLENDALGGTLAGHRLGEQAAQRGARGTMRWSRPFGIVTSSAEKARRTRT